MNRPLHVWLAFGACLTLLLAAMGWVSVTALRLDRVQQQAERQAELEERVRLALWRMDSSLMPLLVEESARPPSAYRAFYGADRAYTKGGAQLKQGEVFVPSPLLTYASSNVLLHFQWEPGRGVTSPQVPTGNQRDQAESGYVAHERIEAFAASLQRLETILRQPVNQTAGSLLSSRSYSQASQPIVSGNNGDVLFRETALAATQAEEPAQQIAQANSPGQSEPQDRQNQAAQVFRNQAELNMRANVSRQAQQQAFVANNSLPQQQPAPDAPGQLNRPLEPEGVFKPLWLGDALVLARQVNLGGTAVVQGCWLNWTNLRPALLAGVKDLLPTADLRPMRQTNGEAGARTMATLPVKLAAGAVALDAPRAWSPVQVSLAVAWGCVLVAALAVAGLLSGIVALSERRAAFVSAVTHELRTPLTTFKMYSEMLAEGMVADEAKRATYLQTLCSEANRLSHLVENVLAYARLERGSARRRVEAIALGTLIERVKPRLLQRAEQAGMTLLEDTAPDALAVRVHVDVSAVEQILFNLVDNACKYAAPGATEKVIHLETLPRPPGGKCAMLRVRDHGQGISAEAARRLFQPFSKSAQEAAHSAPGVGLGLALCRRLSRSLGGDLRWEPSVKSGACFALTLPLSP